MLDVCSRTWPEGKADDAFIGQVEMELEQLEARRIPQETLQRIQAAQQLGNDAVTMVTRPPLIIISR